MLQMAKICLKPKHTFIHANFNSGKIRVSQHPRVKSLVTYVFVAVSISSISNGAGLKESPLVNGCCKGFHLCCAHFQKNYIVKMQSFTMCISEGISSLMCIFVSLVTNDFIDTDFLAMWAPAMWAMKIVGELRTMLTYQSFKINKCLQRRRRTSELLVRPYNTYSGQKRVIVLRQLL